MSLSLSFFFFLGLHLLHMEVPRLGVKSELQLPAHTIATQDLSYVCNLYHSSRQCQILSPLSEIRDRTHNLMVPSRICFCCAMMGTPVHESLDLGPDVQAGWQCLFYCISSSVRAHTHPHTQYIIRYLSRCINIIYNFIMSSVLKNYNSRKQGGVRKRIFPTLQ